MTIAIYAGSFDPTTMGHLSVIGEASRVFGHVVCLVANNPQKKYMLTNEERIDSLRKSVAALVNVSVAYTEGLVVDYAKAVGANVLVRGVRDGSDSQFELRLAQANKALLPSLATVLLPANAALTEVSSSKVKEMLERGERIDALCPPAVAMLLRSKVAEKTT